jgi:hypothetical protein
MAEQKMDDNKRTVRISQVSFIGFPVRIHG